MAAALLGEASSEGMRAHNHQHEITRWRAGISGVARNAIGKRASA